MVRFRRSSLYAKPAPYGLLRIVSMIFLLAVLSMMYQRAADPQSWKWLAAVDEDVPARAPVVVEAVRSEPANLPIVPPAEQEPALALDPDERDAAREEFQAGGRHWRRGGADDYRKLGLQVSLVARQATSRWDRRGGHGRRVVGTNALRQRPAPL